MYIQDPGSVWVYELFSEMGRCNNDQDPAGCSKNLGSSLTRYLICEHTL